MQFLTGALLLCVGPLHRLFEGLRALRDPLTLTALAAVGAVVYGGVLIALFGREWLALYRGRGG